MKTALTMAEPHEWYMTVMRFSLGREGRDLDSWQRVRLARGPGRLSYKAPACGQPFARRHPLPGVWCLHDMVLAALSISEMFAGLLLHRLVVGGPSS